VLPVTSGITRCSVCDQPAHASETDDLDRCVACIALTMTHHRRALALQTSAIRRGNGMAWARFGAVVDWRGIFVGVHVTSSAYVPANRGI
jgi:hypothetical protein